MSQPVPTWHFVTACPYLTPCHSQSLPDTLSHPVPMWHRVTTCPWHRVTACTCLTPCHSLSLPDTLSQPVPTWHLVTACTYMTPCHSLSLPDTLRARGAGVMVGRDTGGQPWPSRRPSDLLLLELGLRIGQRMEPGLTQVARWVQLEVAGGSRTPLSQKHARVTTSWNYPPPPLLPRVFSYDLDRDAEKKTGHWRRHQERW